MSIEVEFARPSVRMMFHKFMSIEFGFVRSPKNDKIHFGCEGVLKIMSPQNFDKLYFFQLNKKDESKKRKMKKR